MKTADAATTVHGFVLADKPAGMPSTALVSRLRKRLSGSRVGHTGTLDRFASGLMLLVVGRATALAERFLHADKAYYADFAFGRSTDTHDPTGETLEERPPAAVRDFLESQQERIETAVRGLLQCTSQRPPLFSALKKDGNRFSDRARQGETELPKERAIRVSRAEVLEIDPAAGIVRADLHVRGGPYIRSFARDLGEQLGFPVHLGALRRHSLGRFNIEESGLWLPDEEQIRPVVLPVAEGLPDWPRVGVPTAAVADVLQGRMPRLEGLPEAGTDFFLVGPEGETLAWAQSRQQGFAYRRVFV